MRDKKPIILVVDDQSVNLQVICDLLIKTGNNYSIMRATNGVEACKIIDKIIPDLIITDWEMPQMSGIELTKHLKQNEKTRSIPVIICTGVMTTSENLKIALDAGAVDYIRKPVDEIELLARTQANLRLAASYAEIKELNATKDKFFSIIAHDVKGPFVSILGFSNLMMEKMDTLDSVTLKKYIEYINISTKQTFKLLENLLEWAKVQMGNEQYSPEKLAYNQVLHDTLDTISVMANQKNISISCLNKEDLYITADKNMLHLVLRNLISNAVKFTHKQGKITIQAIEKETEIEIAVSDNGIGMTADILNRLFAISEKVTRSGTEKEQGTGLGLLLCKEFVNKHGGKIWAESEAEKGSTFKFTIPK